MAPCTAPRKGHRTASGAASCPVHGGRSRYTGFVGNAHQPVALAHDGTSLLVNCATPGEIPAVTGTRPYFDPDKKRRTAKG